MNPLYVMHSKVILKIKRSFNSSYGSLAISIISNKGHQFFSITEQDTIERELYSGLWIGIKRCLKS